MHLRTSLKIGALLFFATSLVFIAEARALELPRALANAPCATLLYPLKEWIKLVDSNPVLKKRSELLTAYFSSGKTTQGQTEAELAFMLQDLRDQGMLRPVLAKALSEARKHPKFPKIPAGDAELVEQFYGLIDSELISKGLSPMGLKAAFKPWVELAAEQGRLLTESGKSMIGDSTFRFELAALTKGKFWKGHKIRILNEAKDAVTERTRMILGAKKSIHLMTWALYGDDAGDYFTDLLIKRHNEGIDVKVMVDGLTANRIGYRESIAKLRAAGIPVIEWRGKVNPYYGQHRKFMIVDAETGMGEVVAGGRNLGNDYLHMGKKPNSKKWSDMDIAYAGPAVRDTEMRFTALWNEQLDRLASEDPSRRAELQRMRLSEAKAHKAQTRYSKSGAVMAVLDHTPNPEGYDPIYLGILKSIEGATKSIDIANAYVILTPALKDAIIRARERGVRVRIFTNSATSVDEAIVSIPILRSLAELQPYGVEVYLKQGDTLHSKFMIFDDDLTWVMSYNLHPRSLRYEGETANVIFDALTAKTMREVYEQDLLAAKRATTLAELEIPNDPLSGMAEKEFRDQL